MMKIIASFLCFLPCVVADGHVPGAITLGPRPFWLLEEMDDNSVKTRLETCAATMTSFRTSDFSIGHRGACMQFPEHTLESYEAAAWMGAGVVECDVTFTSDRELICRHDQCDLHTTTNVVAVPELNLKCTTPFIEGSGEAPVCCTSDFTLAEIKTLCAKMDSSGPLTGTAEEYVYGGTADWRTDLYQYECHTVPTHKESIELLNSYDLKFTPELKTPKVTMPYEGDYTQEDYAQQMIDEYIAAGVPPERVWPQSFLHTDVYYWIQNTDFGDQAVALDGNYDFTNEEVTALIDELVANGVKIVAPPMQRLVDGDMNSEFNMVPSFYATEAKAKGLDIITWTLERTGPGLEGFYWGSTAGFGLKEGDKYNLLHVLHEEVGILGIFSDWPATVTFFANCYDIKLIESGLEEDPISSASTSFSAFVLVASLLMVGALLF